MEISAAEDGVRNQQLVVRSREGCLSSKAPVLAANSGSSHVLHTASLKHIFQGLLTLPILPSHFGEIDTVGSPTKSGALVIENRPTSADGVERRQLVLSDSHKESVSLQETHCSHNEENSTTLQGENQRNTLVESSHVVVEDIDELDITSSPAYVEGKKSIHSDSASELNPSNSSLVMVQKNTGDGQTHVIERGSCTPEQRSNAGVEAGECKSDPESGEDNSGACH